jgi:ATP-dependent Clp protease ATP-binding subunit ClpA
LSLEADGTAARVLASYGATPAQLRAAVVRMMGVGVEPPEGELAFTGRAQDVIDRARVEASIRDEPQAGPEHILLAMVHDFSGAAARILVELDADPAAIRSALDKL